MVDDHVRRNSLRLPGYDYSQSGAVFVTICTHERQPLFGKIRNAKVIWSAAGLRATEHLWNLPDRFPGVVVDTFVVMPDHVHAVLVLGTSPVAASRLTIGEIIRWYKSTMFTEYTAGVRRYGWEPYDGRLWQRNFHDHIIRNNREMERIRTYINANPARWQARMQEESDRDS